jgi:ATP diphosphatase
MLNEKDSLQGLLDIMQQLRDPDTGCPWDKAQSFESIVPHTIEEAYEVADAIAKGDREEIKSECGDLLFQVVFYAQLGKEEGSFTFDDIARSVAEKLIRRHPHVFSEQRSLSLTELNEQWDAIKLQEKSKTEVSESSTFVDIISGLPSLTFAYELQKACAKVGFDWPDVAPVLEKVKEEISEIEEAMLHKRKIDVEEEIGDAFFALVNLARHHKINPDNALRKASYKFKTRFEALEQLLIKSNKINESRPLKSLSLEEMEEAWLRVKKTSL